MINQSCSLDYLRKSPHTHYIYSCKQIFNKYDPTPNTNPSKVSPVQQVGKPLSSVALDDALTPRLLAETKHELCQLVTGLLSRTESPIHNINT